MAKLRRLNKSDYDSGESTIKVADTGLITEVFDNLDEGRVLFTKDYSYLNATYLGATFTFNTSTWNDGDEWLQEFTQIDYAYSSGNAAVQLGFTLDSEDVLTIFCDTVQSFVNTYPPVEPYTVGKIRYFVYYD